jgi:hypothetical protein
MSSPPPLGRSAADAARTGVRAAAFKHPHIAHIHGVEETGSVRALVMEFVEGEDLPQRIA